MIFTAGGSGSGKSETFLPVLKQNSLNSIIFDGTMAEYVNSGFFIFDHLGGIFLDNTSASATNVTGEVMRAWILKQIEDKK